MRELVELAARIADLERRFSGVMRHGTVEEVDTSKWIVRLKLGEDVEGKPFLSPWVPYAQIAGELRLHQPPTKGQQMTMMAPNGDWQEAVALPMHWQNDIPSPSTAPDKQVLTFGDFTITLAKDVLTIKGPKVVIEADVYLGGEDGAKQVHRKDDLDSAGDAAVQHATRVWAK